jgi:hypothetical protein
MVFQFSIARREERVRKKQSGSKSIQAVSDLYLKIAFAKSSLNLSKQNLNNFCLFFKFEILNNESYI